jgi:hypothetical protein
MAALVELIVDGPIARSDVPGLVARLAAVLAGAEAPIVICRLQGVTPTAESLEALARLALVAVRHGAHVRLQGASEPLLELIAFAGMHDVLPV